MEASVKIAALRCEMNNHWVDVYIVPTADPHDSEYVSPRYRTREWLSGFTGSAGTLVVTQKEAVLFTDGRYFIQAERELAGSGITLMKSGEEGVPTVREYVAEKLPENGRIGFDGLTMSLEEGRYYESIADVFDFDLLCDFWEDRGRPEDVHTKIWLLPEKYAGRSAADKLAEVRRKMCKLGADAHLITVLDDICWLFNIRASDVDYCPVALSYALITEETATLFADNLTPEAAEYLARNGVAIRPYHKLLDACMKMTGRQRLLLDRKRVNYRQASWFLKCKKIYAPSPVETMKAVKNPVETENIRQAHIWDGIALTRFMYWLKTNIGKAHITETDAAEKVDSLRREVAGEHFISPSFETISAYGANAAMMHYSAKPGDCAALEPHGMLLVDSGGHYLEGTTDVTRTYALGAVSDEERRHYTLTVRAMLRLAAAKFPSGCRGENLDILARGIMWEYGLDYRCGTGHGVGYLLSVHEGPNSFRHRIKDGVPISAVLEPGMVTTDEPGVYVEGSHGVRIENELLCVKAEKTEYGQFLEFEMLTYAPIDLDCLDLSLMEPVDIERLNGYHEMVYKKISPYLEGEELEFLKRYTKEV